MHKEGIALDVGPFVRHPHSRRGHASDQETLTRLYAKHCRRTYEEVERTLERDHFMGRGKRARLGPDRPGDPRTAAKRSFCSAGPPCLREAGRRGAPKAVGQRQQGEGTRKYRAAKEDRRPKPSSKRALLEDWRGTGRATAFVDPGRSVAAPSGGRPLPYRCRCQISLRLLCILHRCNSNNGSIQHYKARRSVPRSFILARITKQNLVICSGVPVKKSR